MKNFLQIIISSLFIISMIGCSGDSGSGDFSGSDEKSSRYLPPVPPNHVQKFNNLVGRIRGFIEREVPGESRSYFAGHTYNVFLKEAFDPNSSISPVYNPPAPPPLFGIGAMVTLYPSENEKLNGYLIIQPRKGSPAWAEGLRKGDLVMAVDDVNIKGLSLERIVERIRGPRGTRVKLKILGFCDNQEKEVIVTRGPINVIPDWLQDSYFVGIDKSETLNECEIPSDQTEGLSASPEQPVQYVNSFQALYVPLRNFIHPRSQGAYGFNLCSEFFELQQRDLENPLSVGMIIDLRGNPGGALQEVSCMLNTLVVSDDVLVRQLPIGEEGEFLEGTSEEISNYFTKTGFFPVFGSNMSFAYNKNIVVLVDGGSASASEIFSGTLQDMKRGWVVGDRTFGKGTVQTVQPVQPFPGGNRYLRKSMTTAIYTLNSGRSPQGYGIIPDFRFSEAGEPIEIDPSYISYMDKLFFNNIQFENNVWEQNRPDELARLNECVSKPGKLGTFLKGEIENTDDERYYHPLVTDYQLELAKDILSCSPVVDPLVHLPLDPNFPFGSGGADIGRTTGSVH